MIKMVSKKVQAAKTKTSNRKSSIKGEAKKAKLEETEAALINGVNHSKKTVTSTKISSKDSELPITGSTNIEEQENAKATENEVMEDKKITKSKKRKSPDAHSEKLEKTADKKNKSIFIKIKAKKPKFSLEIPPIKAVSGKVFVIGENDVGQLGLGEDIQAKAKPALLELPQPIIEIAAGGMHSVCLTNNGEVMTFGCNDEGALGRMTTDEGSEFAPLKVDIPERVIQISAGDSHSAALSESGQVYLWGNFRSGDGPMGLTADGKKQVLPVKILQDKKVVCIASGNEHLVCLSTEGLVFTCGCGEAGQLGRVSERNCSKGGRRGLDALLQPAPLPLPQLADAIWAGAYTTFVQASGLIYACGLNNYHHLGYKGERARFSSKQVSSFNAKTWLQINGGQHHTLALDTEGLVYALGRKDYGRLGLGEDCEEPCVPTLVPTLQNQKCVDISCGNVVSFAISDQGCVFSWGMGTNSQLGHGNEDDCHVPRAIEGNLLKSWKAFRVSGGGQHTLILASPKEKTES